MPSMVVSVVISFPFDDDLPDFGIVCFVDQIEPPLAIGPDFQGGLRARIDLNVFIDEMHILQRIVA